MLCVPSSELYLYVGSSLPCPYTDAPLQRAKPMGATSVTSRLCEVDGNSRSCPIRPCKHIQSFHGALPAYAWPMKRRPSCGAILPHCPVGTHGCSIAIATLPQPDQKQRTETHLEKASMIERKGVSTVTHMTLFSGLVSNLGNCNMMTARCALVAPLSSFSRGTRRTRQHRLLHGTINRDPPEVVALVPAYS